jgi:hypothetical protein
MQSKQLLLLSHVSAKYDGFVFIHELPSNFVILNFIHVIKFSSMLVGLDW